MPKVRLARFHKESLPSLLGLPGGEEPVVWVASSEGEDFWDILAIFSEDNLGANE